MEKASEVILVIGVKQRHGETGEVVPVNDPELFIHNLNEMFKNWAKNQVSITDAWYPDDLGEPAKDEPCSLEFVSARPIR